MRNSHRGGPGAPVEKAKDFKGSIGKLARYMSEYKISLVFVVIFAITSTVFNIIGPKLMGNATTEILNGIIAKVNGTGDVNFDALGAILLLLIGFYLISSICSFIQGWLMTGVSQKVSYRLRKELIAKINRMPMNYFDKSTHGEALSRVTNDVDTLAQNLNQSITQLVTSVTTIIGVMVMMLSISPLMTLIAVLILPVSMVLVLFVVKISQKYFKSQQEYLGHINGQVEEIYSGHNIVKAFNREERVIEDFNEANDILYKSAWKSQFFRCCDAHDLCGKSGIRCRCCCRRFTGGKRNYNGIYYRLSSTSRTATPITQLAQVSSMLQSTAAAAERVFEFLAEDEEEQCAKEHAMLTDTSGNTRNVTTLDITGDVTFEHVRFGYTPEKIIINDFSARVRQGQKIAIVGPTGAGKTTIVKLLMRFYELNGGRILIDGYDIADFDRSELRELFGMVLQDTWLFKGSIMENIRYGKLDATDDEVIAAAKAAHVDHFIRTLPGGYDMELNEEASNVSQGQKQLLTIARAILANNKILILDEATSSVDTRTEIQIQKAMDNLMKGRTSFVIAHRLSTIKDADLILVLKDGDIIEQGNHEELIAKNGFYAELYNSQFDS